jgi:hypothetical protein
MTRNKSDAARADEGVPTTQKVGGRKQFTAEGTKAGIPVEEMPQVQRQEVGRRLAEEEQSFEQAVKETIPEEAAPGALNQETADTPDFDSMTKEELKAHADEQGYEGVTSSMTKDDMLRAVKKAHRAANR